MFYLVYVSFEKDSYEIYEREGLLTVEVILDKTPRSDITIKVDVVSTNGAEGELLAIYLCILCRYYVNN